MAEPITTTTTLLLLYFIAPPMNVTQNETKKDIEKKSLWTFQSSSQIETSSGFACQTLGDKMIKEIERVNTMTIRAYCLCSHGNEGLCGQPQEQLPSGGPAVLEVRPTEGGPTVQRLGPREKKIQQPKTVSPAKK